MTLAPCLKLPLLEAGQAQKEITHNEALLVVDFLLAQSVEAAGLDTPPAMPAPGQGWITGSAPVGIWAGHAHEIALRTEGGWRFVDAPEGMTLWVKSEDAPARKRASGWHVGIVNAAEFHVDGQRVLGAQRPPIPDISGGTIIDVEVRSVVAQIIATLRAHGIISAA